MDKRIYISGAVTGLNPALVTKNFLQAEDHLVKAGWNNVINPTRLPHDHDQEWEDYMLADLRELFKCDAVYMLRNWRSSRGAKIEHAIAKELNLQIYYESNAPRTWWFKRMLFKQQEVRDAA